MTNSSPGQGRCPWSASVPPNQMPLEAFFRSGVSSIPVALVPLNGGSIRINNPQAIQADLKSVTHHYLHITDVRQFGRGGIVCRSPDEACVADLLKCSSFGSIKVNAFIPPHLACTKGIVRGVDSRLSPSETLEELSAAGVIAIYRCNRVTDNVRVPTESVIATFAGTSCPSELKIWPLIFRVDPLASRPLQCRSCWRFGHSAGGCKSSPRCCVCGEGHPGNECATQTEKCCLCGGAHQANNSDCPSRSQEIQILEVMDKRRCSRREATVAVKERSHGYAGVVARQPAAMDSTISEAIATAVEKSMAKVMERLVESVSDCISQIVSAQLTQLLQATSVPLPNVVPELNMPNLPIVSTDKESNMAGPSNLELDDVSTMDVESRAPKRRGSPINVGSNSRPHSKPKKSPNGAELTDSILERAIATAVLSPPEG